MATSVGELVDMLFTMIDDAKNAPFSGEKCVIERDKALDLLDEIKGQLPVELAEARKIVNARSDYLAGAKREAEDIRSRAESEAKRLVESDEVMGVARKKAAEMMRQAEERTKQLKRTTNEYCEDLLRRTEEALNEALTEARRTRTNFRTSANMGRAADTAASGKNSKVFDVESQG